MAFLPIQSSFAGQTQLDLGANEIDIYEIMKSIEIARLVSCILNTCRVFRG